MKVFLRKKTIKRIIIRKNKSQNWFAKQIKISSGYMSQLMDGSRNPSPKVREKIMNNLPENTFDDLFLIVEDEDEKHL